MKAKSKSKVNTLFTGDNLYVLNGMNSESVNLIYLDPPFNSKKLYKAPVGSKAAGSEFKDMWTWKDVDEAYLEKLIDDYPFMVRFIQSVREIHGMPMMSYLTYMTQRIIEMHRVLKKKGSLYLHCDPTASHYLKIILDRIFGKDNFRNEIVWCYSHGGKSKMNFAKKHDAIFFYSKQSKFLFYGDAVRVEMKSGKTTFGGRLETDKDGRKYRLVYGSKDKEGKTKYYKYYLDKGKIPEDWWIDINSIQSGSKERTGYPTQKPLELMHRIIKAGSKEGDVVLDPFCGCATTMVAAQQLNRNWIGIDISKTSANLVMDRLKDDGGLFTDFVHRKDIPQRTDIKQEKPSQSVKERLYKKQKGLCELCSQELDIKHFEIDHIIPKSRGGGDYYANYQLLCGHCNRRKGNRPMEHLRAKIKKQEETLAKISFGL